MHLHLSLPPHLSSLLKQQQKKKQTKNNNKKQQEQVTKKSNENKCLQRWNQPNTMKMTPRYFYTTPTSCAILPCNYTQQNSLHAHWLSYWHQLNECITTRQQGILHCSHSTAFCARHCLVCRTHHSHSHPQHNSLSMHINMHYTPSTTHPLHCLNLPMHTTNTNHGSQNGTRCMDRM